ncbi:hypothetical protein LB533_20240 [Mesorhizobium sp. BR1-1-13]|uniref:hypothetical protein n=1 Tax=Mesorhizobium sp. BR1-1-13 TaxID=2876656 RepID=UPI001CD18FA0|nr:hypothetical protein [Mesorhizobium sp. BR1-1-13]MBZ9943419.1 hypothetical protein [Mesorhizobium sp. BR1-1-13]
MNFFGTPSVEGAIASIVKGVSRLEKAIAHHSNRAAAELDNKKSAEAAYASATAEVSRATRIKAKLQELVA